MGGTEENEGGELEFSMASNLVDEEKQSVSEALHNQKISQSMVVEEISNSRENGHSTLEKETTHNGKNGELQSFPTQSPSANAIDADAVPVENDQGNSGIVELAAVSDIKSDSKKILHDIGTADSLSVESPVEVKHENHEVPVTTEAIGDDIASTGEPKPEAAPVGHKAEDGEGEAMTQSHKEEASAPNNNGNHNLKDMFLMDENDEGSESGTEEEQSAFMKELENFFKERSMEFKPPKFYGIVVNCLKLWRAVTRLGGYDKVTSCKLWRLVGESFKPPKTCTTVSWTFRGFYEKALLDYERQKLHGGELILPAASNLEAMHVDSKSPGPARARRDAATRAMEGWHSQRVLGNGEVSDPIIKDKNAMSAQKRDKHVKSIGVLKRKAPNLETTVKAVRTKSPRLDTTVVDIGPPADWVKVNVQKAKDCFEVYALVPGLLREEVRVQSDPAGRLVISGEPEHPDNPWGVTPFKKVVNLPARVDPHQTSAVVTLHGQLFVRVPFEQTDQ